MFKYFPIAKRFQRCSWLLVATVSLLMGCDNKLLNHISEVKVESVADNKRVVGFSVDQMPQLGPHSPLVYSFSKQEFDQTRDNWLFRRKPFLFIPSKGHLQPGSILMKDRKASWQGPLLRLPQLETGKAFHVAAWIKTVDWPEPTEASLILTTVANAVLSRYTVGQTRLEPDVWQKLEGNFVAIPEYGKSINTLHFDLPDIGVSYLVDDVSITYAEFSKELEAASRNVMEKNKTQIISNGDVEEGMGMWGHQGGVISRSSLYAYNGSYSILITGRKHLWNAPLMPLQALQDEQRYKFSIFTRLVEGEEPADMTLTIKRETHGQTGYVRIGTSTANDKGWTEITGEFSAPNISQSEQVVLYIESSSPTASYYVDALSVEQIPQK